MRFWNNEPEPEPPARRPNMERFVCNNDDCTYSLTGEVPNRLAYGCLMCETPTRYADLPRALQENIPLYNLSLLWSLAVRCQLHQHDLRPCCPQCYSVIDQDGNIPPVGIWGFGRAGKTVYCAALMMECESRLFKLTGMLKDILFDRDKYERTVVEPLKYRGIIPAKTQPGQHHGLSLKLYRQGWFRKKVTLTDMGGENYLQWFDAKPDEPSKRLMLEHMLRAKEAIFLMSPESAKGAGAAVRRDPWIVAQRVMEVLHEEGCLSLHSRAQLENLLRQVTDLFHKYSYLFVGGGNNLGIVADEIAELVRREDREGLASRLNEELMKVDDQFRPRVLDDQLGGLISFLDRWRSKPEGGSKHDLRLAITIGKSDLLPGISTTIGDVPAHDSARKGIQEWRTAADILNRLDGTNSKRAWHQALRRVSGTARQVLLDFGEEQFVRRAEEKFSEVGYFFVSSLGRDVEPFLEWKAAPPAQAMGGAEMIAPMMPGVGGEQVIMPTRQEAQWSVGKRLRVSRRGDRWPEPQNTLWPLLWILTSG